MIDFIKLVIDFVLHIDKHLNEIVTNYQTWTYLILFLIVFCETGLVVTPFLPGDSLLFTAGAIAALGALNPVFLIVILIIAAFLGDTVNYTIGDKIGEKVYQKNYRYINRKNLEKTHQFYEKHGGKTIIFARFIPIIRTFAPFVAGVGTMTYRYFISYNIIGAVLWVVSFTLAGYFFGNVPIIKRNFSLVVFGIIIISFLPPLITLIKSYLESRKTKSNQ